MRYEHIELDLSTAACEWLYCLLRDEYTPDIPEASRVELVNLENELRSRLQRTDQDPKVTQGDWI